MMQNRPLGFWLLMLFAVLLFIMLLVGQTGALINYDLAVKLGLQESQDIIGAMGVAFNKGFAAGDTMIYAPLLIIGIIGLWLRKNWGIIVMSAVLGISAYWPIVCLFSLYFAKGLPDFHFTHFISYTIMLSIVTILSLLGLCYLCRNRRQLTRDY